MKSLISSSLLVSEREGTRVLQFVDNLMRVIIGAAITGAAGAVATVCVKHALKSKKGVAQQNGNGGMSGAPPQLPTQLAFPKPSTTEASSEPEPTPLPSTPSPVGSRGPKTRPPSERFSPKATGIEPPILNTRPIDIGGYKGLAGSEIDAHFISEYDWLDEEGGSFTVYWSDM